ncbi:MAG: hypothetical protein JJU15_00575 [Pararhodobacter sp.]|nr:hypothetical protein [Pararhodobacter sp.]
MTKTILRRSMHLTGLAAIFCVMAFTAPAGAQTPPDPDAMAAEPVPEHDPDATQAGKTALEHAEDLGDERSLRRRMALQALAEMGVDALPAREVVRFVAEHGGTPDMTDAATDELRIGALSVLATMRAPETNDMLRQMILDPQSLARGDSYATLLRVAGESGVDHDTLRHDLHGLVEAAPDHASHLMVLDALDTPLQSDLQEAVFNTDHDPAATGHFLANLPVLDFLDDADKVAYAVEHRAHAERQFNQTRDVLVAIGTDAALDFAMELDTGRGFARHQTISRFAAGPMPAAQVAGHLLDAARAEGEEREISQVMSSFEAMVRDLSNDAPSGEARADYQRLFTRANSTLITQGPGDAHAIVGIQRQILFLQRHEDLPLQPALDPVFDVLESGSVSPAVHNAAARSLQQTPARIAERDPAYFVDRAMDLLWAGDTPELAELPLTLLTSLMRTPDYVDLVVEAVADQIDPHLERWVMNPATAVAMFSGTLRGLDHSPVRETAAAVMGKALASPELDMDYLAPHFGRGGAALAFLEHNTVDGVVAVFTPVIFASEKPDNYLFNMDSFMQPMMGRPAWLQRDQHSLDLWIGFLDRVVALDDPDFSPVARQALTALR